MLILNNKNEPDHDSLCSTVGGEVHLVNRKGHYGNGFVKTAYKKRF